MYRSAMLWLACERCAAEHPRSAMTLSPNGRGHICWDCELRAQIREHTGRRRGRERYAWLGALVGLTGSYWLLWGLL